MRPVFAKNNKISDNFRSPIMVRLSLYIKPTLFYLSLAFILLLVVACGTSTDTPQPTAQATVTTITDPSTTPTTPITVKTPIATTKPPGASTPVPSATAIPGLPTVTHPPTASQPATDTPPAPTATTQPTRVVPNVVHGQWTQVGLAGTSIQSIYGVYSDGRTIYAAGMSGLQMGKKDINGLWRWTQLRSDPVGLLAVKEPSEIWYTVSGSCAKGEITPLWHSSDAGATWSKLNDNMIFTALFYYNGNIYASTCGGPKKSSDAGKNWTSLGNPKVTNADPYSFAVSPADSNSFYMSFITEGGSSHIMYTADNGKTWQEISPTGEALGLSVFPGGRLGDLYAYGLNSFWYSSDNGKTWHTSTTGLDAAKVGYDKTYLFHGFASNSDDSVLYMGSGVAQIKGNGAFQSIDGGATWTAFGDSTLNNHTVSDFAFMPDGAVYVATDDGVYRIYP